MKRRFASASCGLRIVGLSQPMVPLSPQLFHFFAQFLQIQRFRSRAGVWCWWNGTCACFLHAIVPNLATPRPIETRDWSRTAVLPRQFSDASFGAFHKLHTRLQAFSHRVNAALSLGCLQRCFTKFCVSTPNRSNATGDETLACASATRASRLFPGSARRFGDGMDSPSPSATHLGDWTRLQGLSLAPVR